MRVRMTALSYAAKEGFLNICKLLVSHEADIEHRDENGNTPLELLAANCEKSRIHMGHVIEVLRGVSSS